MNTNFATLNKFFYPTALIDFRENIIEQLTIRQLAVLIKIIFVIKCWLGDGKECIWCCIFWTSFKTTNPHNCHPMIPITEEGKAAFINANAKTLACTWLASGTASIVQLGSRATGQHFTALFFHAYANWCTIFISQFVLNNL